MRLTSSLLVCLFVSTTSYAADDPVLIGLKAINKALSDFSGNSKVMDSPTTNNSAPGSYGSALSNPKGASLTEVQKKQLSTQLQPKIMDAQIKAMIGEANPIVEKVLGMQACFYPENSYGIYQSRGGSFQTFYNFQFKYHDRSQCVNVQRIKNWEASAKNALKFNVMYVSEQSGESVESWYEIQKQLDGIWLFNH